MARAAARLVSLSAFFSSRALCRPGQPDFFNGAALVETDQSPEAFKRTTLRSIEAGMDASGLVLLDDFSQKLKKEFMHEP